jgi:hypothetical protein
MKKYEKEPYDGFRAGSFGRYVRYRMRRIGILMKKKNRFYLIVIPIIVVVIVMGLIFPWLFRHIGILTSPGSPDPVNTYGEFPFRVVYEVADESFEIEDVLIVEYAGIDINDMHGKQLVWNGRLASSSTLSRGYSVFSPGYGDEWQYGYGIKLLDGVTIKGRQSNYIGSVYIDLGSAQYYLGYYNLGTYSPGGVYTSGQGLLDKDALWEQYKISIVETSFSEPMVGDGIDMKPK